MSERQDPVEEVIQTAKQAHRHRQQLQEREVRCVLHHVRHEVERLDDDLAPLYAERKESLSQIERIKRLLSALALGKMPDDILCRIFRFCLEGGMIVLTSKDRRAMPLATLADVCRKWRHLILATPALWNNIFLDFKEFADSNRMSNAARNCLSRSGSLFICLKMDGMAPSRQFGVVSRAAPGVDPVPKLVLPLAERLRELRLAFPCTWLRPFLHAPPGSIPLLESADIMFISGDLNSNNQDGIPVVDEDMTVFENAPSLRRITFRLYHRERGPHDFSRPTSPPDLPVISPGAQLKLPWSQLTYLAFIHIHVPFSLCHAILQQCSSLIFLRLTSFGRVDGTVPSTVLPMLNSLHLGITEDESFKRYIQPLVLPALERVVLTGPLNLSYPREFVSSVIARSKCRIPSISTSMFIADREMQEFLCSFPFLVELQLNNRSNQIQEDILVKMRSGKLLPQLRSFEFHLDARMLPQFIDLQYLSLCGSMLAIARHIQQSGQLTFGRNRVTELRTRRRGYTDLARLRRGFDWLVMGFGAMRGMKLS